MKRFALAAALLIAAPAVAPMSALVPALIARQRLGNAPALQPVLIRAALFALAGGVPGGSLAFSIGAATFPAVGWGTALTIKIAYGSALGVLVATLALLRLLPSVRPV